MSRNRAWHRGQNNNRRGFNPLGNRPRDRNIREEDDDTPQDNRNKKKGQNQRVVEKASTPYDRMTMKLLNLYLQKKWDPNSRMLDLSDMIHADELSELSPNLNNYQFCNKLALAVSEGKEWAQRLDSVNLSHNSIYTLKSLGQAFVAKNVKLQNLALSNNEIASLKEVDWLVEMRLREVLLNENPITKRGDEYHRYVVKKLRSIELLDTVSVKEWRKQLLPKLPEPCDSCISNESTASLVFELSRLFFTCIDDRNFDNLLDAYETDCIFTHVSEPSTRIYTTSNSKQYHQGLQYKNHNLLLPYNIKNPSKWVFKGRPAIIEFLSKDLYYKVTTTHDVSQFKADAINMGDTVIVTLHGCFSYTVEGDTTKYSKCFDRVMMLKPNKSGTQWPARIVNDMLTIRSGQDFPMLMPEVNVQQQLMQVTGLNQKFAQLLLQEASNNYEQALVLFNQNKVQGTIPPEAFQK